MFVLTTCGLFSLSFVGIILYPPEIFSTNEAKEPQVTIVSENPTQTIQPTSSTAETNAEESISLPDSSFANNYELADQTFGTMTTVRIEGNTRYIESNALPNHNTGEFPNSNNPNTISAQDVSYEFTTNPTFNGQATFAREPGVAINGVKFEPQTAERVTCESGEVYSVEAIQDFVSLGLDFNNAHVQPNGSYHYHGVANDLVEFADGEEDIVHVGFAADGYMMYYSRSNQFSPSYKLADELRTGTSCSLSLGPNSINDIQIQDSSPDGSYVSDWVYDDIVGDLDECNGIEIDGQYAYFLTDSYPFIPRCLNGEFTESAPGGGQPGGQRPPR